MNMEIKENELVLKPHLYIKFFRNYLGGPQRRKKVKENIFRPITGLFKNNNKVSFCCVLL